MYRMEVDKRLVAHVSVRHLLSRRQPATRRVLPCRWVQVGPHFFLLALFIRNDVYPAVAKFEAIICLVF